MFLSITQSLIFILKKVQSHVSGRFFLILFLYLNLIGQDYLDLKDQQDNSKKNSVGFIYPLGKN